MRRAAHRCWPNRRGSPWPTLRRGGIAKVATDLGLTRPASLAQRGFGHHARPHADVSLPELVSRLPSLRLGGRARELVTPFFLEGLTSLPAGWELEAPVIVVQP